MADRPHLGLMLSASNSGRSGHPMTSKIPPPTLEELNERIAAVEELRAAWQGLPSKVPLDIELYCLHAVRDGLATAPKLVAETLLNKHFSQAHTDMVGDAEYREGYIKGIHDLVSALLIGAPQSPWMDIETAPKDGTEILGLFFHPRDEDSYPMLSGPWTTCFKDGKWRSSWDGEQVLEYMSDFGSEYKSLFYDPTHWMPLPAPPTHNSPPDAALSSQGRGTEET